MFSSKTVKRSTNSLSTSVRVPELGSKVPSLQVKIAPVCQQNKYKLKNRTNSYDLLSGLSMVVNTNISFFFQFTLPHKRNYNTGDTIRYTIKNVKKPWREDVKTNRKFTCD